jgi:hypothetical protein
VIHSALAAALAGPLLLGPATTPEPAPQPPITLSAEQSAQLCQERIPQRLARIDGLQERIDGDAGVPGSTASLRQRLEAAEAAGRALLADRLRDRVERRPLLLEQLAAAESRLVGLRDGQCAS